MNMKSSLLRVDAIVPLLCFLLLTPHALAPVTWTSIGPGGGGWLSAITVVNDPADTVYVGCDVGGIYKSTDHGRTWQIKNNGLSTYYVQDIAYDPANTAILYAATRGGVFKSVNGGESWVSSRSGFPEEDPYYFSAPVSDIVVDPKTPAIIYAAIGITRAGYETDSDHWEEVPTKGILYKSTNSGATWNPIRGTGIDSAALIYSLTIDPKNTTTLYAATDKGIYRSTDSGTTWSTRNTDLPAHLHGMNIVVNPKKTNILYVTMWAEPGSASWQGGIYKSINAGANWDAKNNGLPQEINSKYGLTSNYPVLVIAPDDTDTLYLGNTPWAPDPGVYKTIDGGESWKWVSMEPGEANANVTMGWITEHGVSVKCLAISPRDPKRLFFGTSTNLFTSENGGVSWQQSYSRQTAAGSWHGTGLETTCVQDIAVDPTDSNVIYAGYWDMGLLKSMDGGQSFKRLKKGMFRENHYDYTANTFSILIDPANHDNIYAAAGWWEQNRGTVCATSDQGENWNCEPTGLPNATIWSIAMDQRSPENARILYAASYKHGVYKSTDSGLHWVRINNGLGVAGNLQVRKILVDPNDSNTLYAGMEAIHTEDNNGSGTVHGGLFKSSDAGATWNRIDLPLPQLSVWDIAVVAGHPEIIYTAVSSEYDHTLKKNFPGGVYKTVDGGASWAKVNSGFGTEDNLDVVAIAVHPDNPNILYAVTSDAPYHDQSSGRGIFRSLNAGITWEVVNDGLGVLAFSALTLDPSNPSILYAGSAGNGIFKGIDHDARQ